MKIWEEFFPVLLKQLQILVAWREVHFRFEWALLFLWAVPFLALWIGRMIWLQYRTSCLMGTHFSWIRGVFAGLGRILSIILFIIATASPYNIEVTKKPVWKGEVLDFVYDLTLSQNAEDVSPSRIKALKRETIRAINQLSEVGIFRLCLGFFVSSFNRLLECTEEMDTVREMIDRLEVSVTSNGTNLLTAFPYDYGLMIKEGNILLRTRINLFIFTDGGREMWIDKEGALHILEEDWNENDLEKKVADFTKEGIRVIPVGVGGSKPVPVYTFDAGGRKREVKNYNDEVVYTKLDEGIIKKIASWTGSPKRFFIFQEGVSLADWISKNIVKDLEVDHYIQERSEKDWWRLPLALGIIFASLSLGALNWSERILHRLLFRR